MLQILLESSPLFLTGASLFGLIIGSFLNVVIYRLPLRLEYDWRCQCKDLLGLDGAGDARSAPPGLSNPPSACPACGHRIRAWENIPIVSYLFLRGNCAGCTARISLRYPLVELLTGVAFLVVAWQFGPTVQALAGMVLTAMLIAMSGIDLDHQLLPDNMTLPLLWLGLLINLWSMFTSISDAVVGAIIGYGVLWLVFHVFRLLTGKEGMGYGDFKLLGALGAWFGWQALPVVIVLSSVSGAIIGLAMMSMKRHSSGQPIPFGPFIALAGWVYLLWGDELNLAYLRFAGLAS